MIIDCCTNRMSKDMMHTVVSVRNIPGTDQIELLLREEHSDSLLLRARHEVGESRFLFLDADDGDVVASLSKDNLLGLAWTLRGVDETRLARIRFGVSLTDTPVSFEVELGEEAISEQESESQLSNYLFQSLNLNIVECLPVSGEPFSSYSTLAHDNQSQSYAHVHDSLGRLTTRAPLWNSEANCYLSNFGSRVRVTANTNFILVPRETSNLEENSRVIVRFGRVLRRGRKWVLDFRQDVDVLQVFAIACAALAEKPFVCS